MNVKDINVGIIGSGYVGKRIGTYLLNKGFDVIFYDIDKTLLLNLKNRGYKITTKIIDIAKRSISFVCVPTPTDDRGNMILDYVIRAVEDLGKALSYVKNEHVLIIKSTILPGTTKNILIPKIIRNSNKTEMEIGVIYSPEFLTEFHNTWSDSNIFKITPENEYRIIIGEGKNKKWGNLLINTLYSEFKGPIIRTDYTTAEMIKYASNIALACKISYWNQIFMVCEALGIDSEVVAEAASHDPRIGRYGTVHGKAFGGKCLPKDLKAFIAFSDKFAHIPLLKAIDTVNEYMKRRYGVRKRRRTEEE